MVLNFGPKFPNRVIRMRDQKEILRIESSKIEEAAWEEAEDGDDSW
jgi:hypothetical protein